MLTKNQEKLIKNLHNKSGRDESGMFLVEGEKSVIETINSGFGIDLIIGTRAFFDKNKKIVGNTNHEIVAQDKLERLGTLTSNDSAIAIVKKKAISRPVLNTEKIIIALDKIQDPGNLGTIIRIADWYGIKNIIVSSDTADFYNSKTISASMGSFSRVNVYYTDLKDFFKNQKVPILGTFLAGKDIHKMTFPKGGILLIGNEANGISRELENIVTEKISIPPYGKAESLNAGIATAVILDNWLNQSK